MVGMTCARVWVVVLLLSTFRVDVQAQFFDGFYNAHCPNAEAIVTQAVTQAFNQDPTISGALLRMLFHDCFVQGCDGSILLDATPQNPNPEKTANPNLTVRGYEVIDAAKVELERICPQTVSCADIIALAGRDAVVLSGGQTFAMPTGRLDGFVSNAQDAVNNLVSTSSSASDLTQKFAAQGLNQDEMITLSGAHTIGRAHCSEVLPRLYNFPGSATGADPSLEPSYAAQLQQLCPPNASPNAVVPLDPVSPNTFDNMYYTNGVTGRVLFHSDNALFADAQTQFTSNLNSQNAQFWQTKFGNALVRLASINVKQGQGGEVRKNSCRLTNANHP